MTVYSVILEKQGSEELYGVCLSLEEARIRRQMVLDAKAAGDGWETVSVIYVLKHNCDEAKQANFSFGELLESETITL